ncbi:hypothetical protein VAEU17_4320031 [Vibrio aestuarianus]|nr:hypothetical protein VAEKB19_3780046 [Vibrio aestuarianus]CAH8230589.1 hypothetical protein VAEU17_4320031 [Vibrio aestuarianus]
MIKRQKPHIVEVFVVYALQKKCKFVLSAIKVQMIIISTTND